MSRRIFISYQHQDQLTAKGFHLMRYNQNLDLNFVGRHLLDPVKSRDSAYISRKIREQIIGSSVTVVIVGSKTAQSDWIDKEIQWSLEKSPPNGIIGIRLNADVQIPQELQNCGAEILDWFKPEDVHEFQDAIERAALASQRAALMPVNSTSTCSR